ncbi:MAG: nucleotide sugar dehydrogenase [Magnetovibrionaceae bacterium]
MSDKTVIAVVGLGYVGLPLAVHLARHFPTIGFDISQERVSELQRGLDRTGEVDDDTLRATSLQLTADAKAMQGADIYVVTVPTPVTEDNQPDLRPVLSACETVGAVLKAHPVPGAIVCFESTVYPGVTEDICAPALEKASGLKWGVDFHLGYSPERINPGDREHTVDRIAKVVAGESPAITERLCAIYGKVTTGEIFPARDIKTAEASKVIENAQRDINIAFINEIARIFQKLDVSVYDVLEASKTKWNFLNFQPGLVGGHCIGVDPYYLSHCAQALGLEPEVILAGRRINDGMGDFLAGAISGQLEEGPKRLLVLGLTFKENVPDLRNSKVVDLVRGLEALGHSVAVHDPLADPEEAKQIYDIDLETSLSDQADYDAVVGAVPHKAYVELSDTGFEKLVKTGGLIADVKGMWRHRALPAALRRWQL